MTDNRPVMSPNPARGRSVFPLETALGAAMAVVLTWVLTAGVVGASEGGEAGAGLVAAAIPTGPGVDFFATLGGDPQAEDGDTRVADTMAALGLSFLVENTLGTKYVSRGVRDSDAPVWQPYVAATWKDITAYCWANMDLTADDGARNRFTEYDLGVKYTKSLGEFDLLLGVVNYQEPNNTSSITSEIYGGLGYKCWLTPMITVYQDIDENRGQYVRLQVEHTFVNVWEPWKGVTVDAVATAAVAYGSAAYNDASYNANTAGFTDASISLSMPVHVSKRITVTPMISAAQLLDSAVRRGTPGESSTVWGALTVSYRF